MSKFTKSLCKIAIPVTLQSMLQASFSIIDQVMIGQLEKQIYLQLDYVAIFL
nr:hypothetical protein [uncultured Anaerobutyricum sp.]